MKAGVREGEAEDFQRVVLSPALGCEASEGQCGAWLGACTSSLRTQDARPPNLSVFCLFIPGQLPALHSIFLLCFHGNTIAPGVHGPDRGEEEKGLERSTRGRQSPGARLSSEAPTGQGGCSQQRRAACGPEKEPGDLEQQVDFLSSGAFWRVAAWRSP